MLTGIFHLIVIAVAVWAIITGYRKGFLRQLGAVLAVCFAIISVRLLAPEFEPSVEDGMPDFVSGFKRPFVVATVTCGIIYILVAGVVELIAFPLGKMMKVLQGGVINSICGALFRMFQYLMLLSIVYNFIVDMNPSGSLTRSSRQHDGNVVEGVMKIAPAVLDFPDGEEVGYYQQLEDAKKIS